MVSSAGHGQVPHPSIVPECFTINQLWNDRCTWPWGHCLLSELREWRLQTVLFEGDARNRWRDGLVCPAVDKELWRLGPDGSVHSRHGVTLNSRRAASPLVRLEEGEEGWEAPEHPQGVLPQNWCETELNRFFHLIEQKECTAFHSRRESISGERRTSSEDTSIPYSGFKPEPTRLQVECHIHHTDWVAPLQLICTFYRCCEYLCK
ncbi:uncharacterized protein TNCV_341591 [Trichonephila clavipes]|nr:uncharacterized protein TNCV_341591 [Trichonephila clavipes]